MRHLFQTVTDPDEKICRTAERVVIYADNHDDSLVDQKMMYVGMSQAEASTEVFIVDREKQVSRLLERTGQSLVTFVVGEDAFKLPFATFSRDRKKSIRCRTTSRPSFCGVPKDLRAVDTAIDRWTIDHSAHRKSNHLYRCRPIRYRHRRRAGEECFFLLTCSPDCYHSEVESFHCLADG
jgi:hypothetical protein